ncbi:hypothetical protein NP493_1571g00025 [Ridgeia piscesae]|uniref:Voltage-dependent calcium channel gamma-5 subunit n=1 Tax=Ridgeia piscesae TaxID=27915 RepID=A0AAD9K029_RIDPI|nr:hypothetical protein NP493_1571g00025 [Ridgeia piscesae]
MRRSTLFPVISLIILLVGEVFCFLGHCNHRKKINTFVSGILFVVGGLVILVGIILFIGAITEEVGNKSKSGMDEPRFVYRYGSSFILTISSFIISELTGVLSVYLYISRYKHAYRKKQEHMAMIDANERPNATTTLNRRASLRSPLHQSCDHSRENSPCRSETYYTYTPVSYSSKETSNYTLPREVSRHTVSTMADTHAAMAAASAALSKDSSVHSVRELDNFRRTTPV